MKRRRDARSLLVLAVGVLVLAACGSTAAPSGLPLSASGPGSAGVTNADGLGAAPSDQAAAVDLGAAPTADGLPRDTNVTGPSAGGMPAGTNPLSGERTMPPGAVTTTKLPPIQIGTYYLDGGTEALAAQGVGLEIPNNKPLFDAMVKHLNSRGGLAGRQIQPVYYKYSYGGDPQAQDAAACAQFTEDNDAYLVIGGISSGAGQLAPCLIKNGVPLIGANNGGDARYFAKNSRYIYEPGQANFTAGLTTLVAELGRTGVLTKASSLGVVQYEGATYDAAVDDGLIPALAKLGLKLRERASVSCCDNATIASASANAQLKFSTVGIDRVIFMAPGGAVANAFMQSASTQGYRPQYGIWSADSPFVLATVAPKDQLRAASGIGYQPGLDVASAQDPTATTPAAKKCLEFWDSVGHSDRSGLNNPLKRASCDIFNTLLRAVEQPQATTSTAALEAGFDAIGSSYSPAGTFATRFVPGSHDAANGYRRLAYVADCSCFAYQGQTRFIRG